MCFIYIFNNFKNYILTLPADDLRQTKEYTNYECFYHLTVKSLRSKCLINCSLPDYRIILNSFL